MAKRQMVTRRAASASVGNLGIIGAVIAGLKSFLMTGIILAVLFFSLNLVMKYATGAGKASNGRQPVKAQSREKAAPAQTAGAKKNKQAGFEIGNPFKTPMYTIIGNEELTVFSDGSTQGKDAKTQDLILPVITGDVIGENAKKNGAYRQILKLDKKYLTDISEVKITNPKDIVMITVAGKILHFGDSVNNEKMSQYALVMREFRKLRKKYSSADLSVSGRVIIK